MFNSTREPCHEIPTAYQCKVKLLLNLPLYVISCMVIPFPGYFPCHQIPMRSFLCMNGHEMTWCISGDHFTFHAWLTHGIFVTSFLVTKFKFYLSKYIRDFCWLLWWIANLTSNTLVEYKYSKHNVLYQWIFYSMNEGWI